jgi:peroxiredoxin Q/BCP
MKKIKLPKFKLEATGGDIITPKNFEGQLTVLYFYPKDNTPGCTTEGLDFRKLHAAFKKAGAQIFGVSRDPMKAHDKFKEKCEFPFELISDPDDVLCKAFDVIQMKSMYGKSYEGIERSTFILDKKGEVLKEWRKVKVPGHAAEVLDFIKNEI